nr:hypothetical protein [uncultured Duganella sp.]
MSLANQYRWKSDAVLQQLDTLVKNFIVLPGIVDLKFVSGMYHCVSAALSSRFVIYL